MDVNPYESPSEQNPPPAPEPERDVPPMRRESLYLGVAALLVIFVIPSIVFLILYLLLCSGLFV